MRPAQNIITAIAHRYNLKLLVYFGSYLTEWYLKDSDIDLAFLADQPLTSLEKMELHKELIIAHRKSDIDLVDLQTAETVLRYAVATDGKVLFEREEGMFERYALFYTKQFYEMRPYIQEEMRQLAKEIRELDIDG